MRFSMNMDTKELIKGLNRYENDLAHKVDGMLKRACESAKVTAENAYSSSEVAPYESLPHVIVEKLSEYEYVVSANGRQVCFLEFGAGQLAGTGGGYESVSPVPTSQGSWSKEHAQAYIKNGFWYYNGNKFYYITPTRALFNAMQSAIKTISDETQNGGKK